MLILFETQFKPYCKNQLRLIETHFKHIAISSAADIRAFWEYIITTLNGL